MYSRKHSENASEGDSGSNFGLPVAQQIGNSSTYVTEKPNNNQKSMKLMKVDKSKLKKNQKKQFPDLKMMVNGDHRNSNYTMFSEDEQFNVSNFHFSSDCVCSSSRRSARFRIQTAA